MRMRSFITVIGFLVPALLVLGCVDIGGSPLPDIEDPGPKEGPVTIYLAGDSTVASYSAWEAPLAGWGQKLHVYFGPGVEVDNHAVSGRSSKSFIREGRLAAILDKIQPGDYLFIQFGHNDAKPDSTLYTEPRTTFQAYLSQYVTGARERGAIPVLITPMQRRLFDASGHITPSHGDYPDAMIELAAELAVPLIDLHEKTTVLFESLGDEQSKELFLWLQPGEYAGYPAGREDNSHLNLYGAEVVAGLVAEGIREQGLPLADLLVETN